MSVSRRFFFGAAAGAAAGTASSKAALTAMSHLTALTSEPIRPPGGAESFHAGTCTECAAGCGTRVRKIGDRAVFVGGNPTHPLSRGGLCPRGLASLHGHYHPDRLLTPQRRASKGEPLSAVDWEPALEQIVTRLAELRAAGAPQRFALLHERRNDPLDLLARDFARAFGSPNDLTVEPLPPAVRAAWHLTQGTVDDLAYDLERAGMVLSFGADLLDGFGSPGYALNAFGRFRQRTERARGHWVQIEPRLSVTGSRADQRISVRPGTEGILAMGLAYVLIAERLYDRQFVDAHVTGFEDSAYPDGRPRQGFRNWVLANFSVSTVADQTRVPPETIIGLARELVRHAPTVALPGRSTALTDNGVWSCWAIHCLNALLGSIGVDGGVLAPLPVPYAEASMVEPDAIAAAGIEQPAIGAGRHTALPSAVPPDPISALLDDEAAANLEVLLVIECDPVALSPAPEEMRRVLAEIPLVVLVSAHPNETTAAADLVLPSPSSLERWDMVANPPLTPYTVCSLRAPVIEPRGDVRHPGDLLATLAASLGEPMASVAPWDDYEACLRASVDKLLQSSRGDVFGAEFEANYTRMMQRAGLWTPAYRVASQLWTQMQEQGGWWDPMTYTGEWRRMLRTPTGRFDMSVRQKGRARAPQPDEQYPLVLFPFELLAVAHGRFNDTPFTRNLSGPHFDGPMRSWVELHPETADGLGLQEGDRVVVASEHAEVEADLRIYAGVEPGIAAMPLGFGRTAGRWTADWGSNALRLVARPERVEAGQVSEYETRVTVGRA